MKKFLSKFENRTNIYAMIAGFATPLVGMWIAPYSIVLALLASIFGLFIILFGLICLDYLLIEKKKLKG